MLPVDEGGVLAVRVEHRGLEQLDRAVDGRRQPRARPSSAAARLQLAQLEKRLLDVGTHVDRVISTERQAVARVRSARTGLRCTAEDYPRTCRRELSAAGRIMRVATDARAERLLRRRTTGMVPLPSSFSAMRSRMRSVNATRAKGSLGDGCSNEHAIHDRESDSGRCEAGLSPRPEEA